jgi:hypothetical protein
MTFSSSPGLTRLRRASGFRTKKGEKRRKEAARTPFGCAQGKAAVRKAGASSRTPQEPAAGTFGERRLAAALQSAAWLCEDQSEGKSKMPG